MRTESQNDGTTPARPPRSAAEAGWHESRYNLYAPLPGSANALVANLLKGTCCQITPLEGALLKRLNEIGESHPIVDRLARRGIICNFDELCAVEALGRAACSAPFEVKLTICPTMRCNFACPYCFQEHEHDAGSSVMIPEVQDDVLALAQRLLEASHPRTLRVMWFGGEPLLAPAVIESLSARLSELARSHGANYRAQVTTNGYLLTRKVSQMLGRASVEAVTVTLDGVGADHDATRPLAGGGPTFERIVANLRDVRHPFKVAVRHNLHRDNQNGAAALEALVARLAQESGNTITYGPALVSHNAAEQARRSTVETLDGALAADVAIRQEAMRFEPGRGHYCSANQLFSVTIDERGRLYKCWEALGKPGHAFGQARHWGPRDPLATADAPDALTRYLNAVAPLEVEPCRSCVWLPLCAGGCPYKRFAGERTCVPFKDDPASFVQAVYRHKRGQA